MVAKANGKRTDWERLEELEGALYSSDSDHTVTISISNYNWLMEKASHWIHRDKSKVQHESYNWTPGERLAMKKNGLTTNNVATRIKFRGWSREEAVNTPKISEEERRERVAEGTRKYHRERGGTHGNFN